MGGIGKSTLAAQIAARVRRLQPSRVITVMSGEVSAAAFAAGPVEAARQISGPAIVACDPAMCAALSLAALAASKPPRPARPAPGPLGRTSSVPAPRPAAAIA